jgi:hypothetical protein
VRVAAFPRPGPCASLSRRAHRGPSFTDPPLIKKFRAKGIDKFIAYELPLSDVKERYGGHFQLVMQDLHETDNLRVLDMSGERAFRLFSLSKLPAPVIFEATEKFEPAEKLGAPMPADDATIPQRVQTIRSRTANGADQNSIAPPIRRRDGPMVA